jgi:hypothetical protein
MNAGRSNQKILFKRNVVNRKAVIAVKALINQLLFCAVRLYTRQKVHMDI